MSYKIKLRAEGFELEIEGDREFIESKLSNLGWLDQVFNKFGQPRSSASQTGPPARPLTTEKLAFNEFASLLKLNTDRERFLAIAYYLYRWEDRDLTYEDVENYYRMARWPMPSNPRDVMSGLKEDGYMEDVGKINGRKAFRILQKGIQYVEEALQRGGRP